jgi:hypothetical protein
MERRCPVIRKPDWQPEMLRLLNQTVSPNHSAAVVAVDEQGNVASLLHTCNCYGWGSTGIFVDGVSIPNSASFQQRQIADASAGARLAEGLNPLIVLKMASRVSRRLRLAQECSKQPCSRRRAPVFGRRSARLLSPDTRVSSGPRPEALQAAASGQRAACQRGR